MRRRKTGVKSATVVYAPMMGMFLSLAREAERVNLSVVRPISTKWSWAFTRSQGWRWWYHISNADVALPYPLKPPTLLCNWILDACIIDQIPSWHLPQFMSTITTRASRLMKNPIVGEFRQDDYQCTVLCGLMTRDGPINLHPTSVHHSLDCPTLFLVIYHSPRGDQWWWRGDGQWQQHRVPPIFFSSCCAVFGIPPQLSRPILGRPFSLSFVIRLPSHLSNSALSPPTASSLCLPLSDLQGCGSQPEQSYEIHFLWVCSRLAVIFSQVLPFPGYQLALCIPLKWVTLPFQIPTKSSSLTHQALSPLFTVAAYALLFGVSYSSKTYISLLPLTVGVMLACSFDVSASNAMGLICAFGSALVFVSSNIFFKKIMPSHSEGTSSVSSLKLDKMNLLLYSSGMAFLLMIPVWMYYDLPLFLSGTATTAVPSKDEPPAHSVIYYFFINGTVHYAQNIIAFVILSSTSPVTYSIASLIKRVAVICIAIIWFKQSVHPIQALGIVMTFAGLYMYNNAKGDVDKGEKKLRRMEATKDMMLPTTKADSRMLLGTESPPPEMVSEYTNPSATVMGSGTVYGRARGLSISGVGHQAAYSHRPPASTLYIKTSKDILSKQELSPLEELYPSPPPSHDSPTSHTIPLSIESHA